MVLLKYGFILCMQHIRQPILIEKMHKLGKMINVKAAIRL